MGLLKIEEHAAEIKKLRDHKKTIEERLDELTTIVKGFMDNQTIVHVGPFVIVLSEKTRTDLDKKALTTLLGEDLKKYEKKTTYKTLEIKQ
jgi:hypothetical protein